MKHPLSIGLGLILAISGCNVTVSGPTKGANDCAGAKAAGAAQFRDAISEDINRARYSCLDADVQVGKSLGPDPSVSNVLRQALDDKQKPLPDTAKVAAVSYLVFASRGTDTSAIDKHLESIRAVAMSGPEESRGRAISVLSVRRSDDDLDLFSRGVNSGSESVLAFSAFALIDNCSPAAQKTLMTALESSAMQGYLKKYSDKESISGLIRDRCPAVLNALAPVDVSVGSGPCIKTDNVEFNAAVAKELARTGIKHRLDQRGVCVAREDANALQDADRRITEYQHEVVALLTNACEQRDIVDWAKRENVAFDIVGTTKSDGTSGGNMFIFRSLSAEEVSANREKLARYISVAKDCKPRALMPSSKPLGRP